MTIPIELTEESRDLLVRHFQERTELHEILEHATAMKLPGLLSVDIVPLALIVDYRKSVHLCWRQSRALV
jgi:hypothetical protein